MGLIDRLNRLDERFGVVNFHQGRVTWKEARRELLTYPLALWMALGVGILVIAIIWNFLLMPFGILITTLTATKAADQVRIKKLGGEAPSRQNHTSS